MKRVWSRLLCLLLVFSLTSFAIVFLTSRNGIKENSIVTFAPANIPKTDEAALATDTSSIATGNEIESPSSFNNEPENSNQDKLMTAAADDSVMVSELDEGVKNPRVLIVGVSSFVGYHLSILLTKQYHFVKLVEDSNLQHTFDPMIGKRINKLKELRDSPAQFVDFSDQSKPKTLINDFKPDVIVYIPTPLFSHQEATTANRYFYTSDFSRELKFFLNILTNIKESNSHMVFSSSSSVYKPSSLKVWFNSHERLLSSLSVHSSILRLYNVYGEWKLDGTNYQDGLAHWYVDDVVDAFLKVVKSSKNVFVDFGCPTCSLQGYLKVSASRDKEKLFKNWEFTPSHGRSVVMTTYFTGVKNPMHSVGYATNKFRFMRSWFLSARSLGLHMVMFHDRLSDDFRMRVKDFYPHIEFVKSSSAGESPNDKRFRIFADYISSHSDVQNILLTDLRDITLGHNPFEIMRNIGDYVFVGQDLPYFFSTSSYGFVLNKVSRCYGVEARAESVKLYTLFNAGVLGGSRSAILVTLELINSYLRKSPSSLNCNMPALAIVLHKHLYEQTFSGYPFNSLFGVEYAGATGIAVMHKTGHRIYP